MLLRRPFPLAAAALVAASLACSDSSGPSGTPVASVAVAGLPDSIGVGDIVTLVATAKGRDGAALEGATFAWRSLSPGLAVVYPGGQLTALAVGDARLVVTTTLRGTREDTITARLRALPRRITLAAAADSITVFDTVRVQGTTRDGLGGSLAATVVFSSSDTSRAIVDAQGVVKPRGYGTVWVRGRVGDLVDSVAVKIALTRTTPDALWPGTGWTQAAPGGFSTQGYATCALDAAGLLSCTTQGNASPVSMGTTALRTLGNGYRQACGLAADSTAYCVGSNAEGEFGLGAFSNVSSSNTLVAVTPGKKWRQLEVGDNRTTCGIQAADSVVYCWGLNDNGQTGRLPTSRSAPDVLPFATPLKAKKVDVGYFSGCALALDNALWCWGEPLAFLGGYANDLAPTIMAPAGSYVDVAVAGNGLETCALAPDGTAWCWGDDVERATTGADFTRHKVTAPVAFTRLVGGTSAGATPCGITADGSVYCFAKLPGSVAPVALPAGGGLKYRSVSIGFYRTCGITTDDLARCW